LRNAHAQTLWGSLCRLAPHPVLRRQRLELPDGDFLDLDWGDAAKPEQPLVLVLHGLEGSARSPYVRALAWHLEGIGMQALIVHFRGCSGVPNRLMRSYHSGETGDLDLLMRWLRRRWPHRAIGVVGYSLGGNVLLKWLGEHGTAARVEAAVAVSVPMDLAVCAERMQSGMSRLYCWRLVRSLKAKVLRKFRDRSGPLDLARVRRARGFREFDDAVTAPLHGFTSAEDYYRRSSSCAWLAGIRRPTLILHAADDPFMTPAVLPPAGDTLPAELTLELSAHGGHVGFVASRGPLGLLPGYWLEARIGAFLRQQLAGA
jgi:predicted alpha/beta-fold hydrolase